MILHILSLSTQKVSEEMEEPMRWIRRPERRYALLFVRQFEEPDMMPEYTPAEIGLIKISTHLFYQTIFIFGWLSMAMQ